MGRRRVQATFITPCYNSALFLDEAVTSVLGQTLGDIELMLIDDESSDDTLEIARRYQREDDRVSVVALPKRGGTAAARNAGIERARGDWLAILDADDIAMETRLEHQLAVAKRDPDVVVITADSVSIDSGGSERRVHRYPTSHRRLLRRLLRKQAFPAHSATTLRTKAVIDCGAFNPRFHLSEDRDLLLRLSSVGKFASVAEPLSKQRRHEGQQSSAEGGSRQLAYTYVAHVCHSLRTKGYPDPSTTGTEEDWLAFIEWVSSAVAERGLAERHWTRVDLRDDYLGSRSRVRAALQLGVKAARSPSIRRSVGRKLVGSAADIRALSTEWADLQGFGSSI